SQLINEENLRFLVEMDDSNNHNFSSSILKDYFEQTRGTIAKMKLAFEKAVTSKQFVEIARMGHYLKGSSCIVGAKIIQDICDKIQNHKGVEKDD
ncbi:hypothetical protein BDK51DRAFT_1786, partial [Blyttiomyces helicus]